MGHVLKEGSAGGVKASQRGLDRSRPGPHADVAGTLCCAVAADQHLHPVPSPPLPSSDLPSAHATIHHRNFPHLTSPHLPFVAHYPSRITSTHPFYFASPHLTSHRFPHLTSGHFIPRHTSPLLTSRPLTSTRPFQNCCSRCTRGHPKGWDAPFRTAQSIVYPTAKHRASDGPMYLSLVSKLNNGRMGIGCNNSSWNFCLLDRGWRDQDEWH